MASKLEYLQRYMSAAPDAGEKKLRKKKKKAAASGAQNRFQVVDADHEWEQDAPSKDAIEQKWEMDAADEERPVVVADGEIVDASDLPVYVNAEEYLEELHAKKHAAADKEDLSPPRKARQRSPSPDVAAASKRTNAPQRKYSSDGSPPRKIGKGDREGGRRGRDRNDEEDGDASPPRHRNAPARSSRRRADSDNDDDGDASPPRRQRPVVAAPRQGQRKSGDDDDASPPRRRPQQERKKEAASPLPVRRRPVAKDDDSDASPVRRPTDRKPTREEKREDDEDASPPRKRRAVRDSSDGESPLRRTKDAVDSKAASAAKEEEPSSRDKPRRMDSLGRDIPETKRGKSRLPSCERRRGRSRSPSVRRRGGQRSSSRFERCRSRSKSRSTSPRSRSRRSPSRSRDRDRGGRRRTSRSRSPQRGRMGGRESSYRDGTKSSRRASQSRSKSPSQRRGRDRDRDTRRRSRSPARSGPRASSAHQDRRSPERKRSSPSPAPAKRREEGSKEERVRKEIKSQDKEERSSRKDKEPSSPVVKQSEKKTARAEGESKEEPQPARAGLFTATEFAVEHKRKLRQNDFLRTADAKDMGANAETVYRDKRGRKLDMLNEMVRQQEILDGKRERQAREEYEWGTGKVQKEELKSQRELMEQMKSAPFARREDDPELEKLRKERVRAFDPINSKVFQEDDIFGTGSSKKKSSKKSKKNAGAATAKPKYAGPPAPPNRFGIQPGYRWDGVVRGTGWEEKLLLRQNKQSAVSEEAYRYAVADM